jgi:hypothetical protein
MRCVLFPILSLLASTFSYAQNVGIGTSTPAANARATIQTVADNTVALQIRNPSSNVKFEMFVGGVENDHVFSMGTSGNMPLAIYSNSTNRIFISGNGNVGIGTSTPSASVVATVETPDYSTALQIRNPTSSVRFDMFVGGPNNNNTFSMGTNGDMPIALYTNSANRLFIAGNGNMGVGTDVPKSKLEVGGGVSLPIRIIAPANDFTNIYSINENDYTVVVDMSGASNGIAQLNLPNAFECKGRIYHVATKKLGNVTSEGRSKVQIYYYQTMIDELYRSHFDGTGTTSHSERLSVTLQSTGLEWVVINADYFRYFDYH